MIQYSILKKWRGRFIRYAPLVLWIGVIFYFSSMQGASSNTSRFLRPILEYLFPNTPEATLLIYHSYIRKFAHFAEYAVLAFWMVRAAAGSAFEPLRKNGFLFAFGLVLVIASADELNQSLNPARTSSAYDVLLDCFGGVAMIAALYMIRRFSQSDNRSRND